MPYRYSHYNRYGNIYICDRGQLWWPGGGGDFNDPVRNQVTSAYYSLFGRYGEQSGVERYVGTWVYHPTRGGFSSIYQMVRAGGDRNQGGSGELQNVQSQGRHTNLGLGANCPFPGCTDSQASNYNPSATFNDGSCTYYPPTVSLSISPSSIIRGQNATVSWSTSRSTSRYINIFGSVGTSGSRTVSPNSTTTYILTASGLGGTRAVAKTLTVYIPPIVTLSLNNSTIVLGQSAILSWNTTGDASTVNVQPGIGPSNIVSQVTVSPTVTTTYTATASGVGGVDSDQITLTVFPPPEVNLNGPIRVTYGENVVLTHEQERATIAYELQIAMTDLDGNITNDLVDLGASASADGTYIHNVPYNNRGPSSIAYILYAIGPGNLTDSESITVNVDIDQMPFNIEIPESDDKIKNETPIISPDVEVTTEKIVIDDVDIPVEVKADYPIQVDLNQSDNWTNIREI